MMNYIVPQIIKYQNVEDLLTNNNKDCSLFEFDKRKQLSIGELL